ncbi:hypothetical protein GCM10011352_28320 [Marinobacterium zhoushanense]|uniref:Rhodanese domain-containing protein n=1 Tax=Marinobacterium zhoushanense TaxID=1679163 RepID=A0ABQ1KIW5_9GAMM|nr:ankyrin repeat domain-containing protein [Marinobacterium zhoushanense]GGC00508.1 hypothetical protein GCM10011352_28320 [Marinobacterium zhoushanense]
MLESLQISIAEVESLLDRGEVLVLDLRQELDYDQAHLPQALHLNDRNMTSLLMRTPRERTVVIYCYQGSSSIEMARMFREFGFEQSYSLAGGFAAWIALSGEGESSLSVSSVNNSVDQPGDHGLTQLMVAAHRGDSLEVAQLIARGADVNRRNDDGNNALWFACRADSPDTVRELIRQGVNVDNQNLNAATPLIWSSAAGKREMVEMLLAAGADTELRTLDDFSALDVASSRQIMKLLMATTRIAVGQ